MALIRTRRASLQYITQGRRVLSSALNVGRAAQKSIVEISNQEQLLSGMGQVLGVALAVLIKGSQY